MSKRELPCARARRELRETRSALAAAHDEIRSLGRNAAQRDVLTQRIALSTGMATITHPATMTARDVERLSALIALLGTDDARQILHAVGPLGPPVVALCGLLFDGLDLDAHGFLPAGSRHVTCVECLSARSAQHVPQPVPQVEQPPARADGKQHGDDGEGV